MGYVNIHIKQEKKWRLGLTSSHLAGDQQRWDLRVCVYPQCGNPPAHERSFFLVDSLIPDGECVGMLPSYFCLMYRKHFLFLFLLLFYFIFFEGVGKPTDPHICSTICINSVNVYQWEAESVRGSNTPCLWACILKLTSSFSLLIEVGRIIIPSEVTKLFYGSVSSLIKWRQ